MLSISENKGTDNALLAQMGTEMGKATEQYFKTEIKRLRREALSMERSGLAGYEAIIRIYRKDADSMEAELAEAGL